MICDGVESDTFVRSVTDVSLKSVSVWLSGNIISHPGQLSLAALSWRSELVARLAVHAASA